MASNAQKDRWSNDQYMSKLKDALRPVFRFHINPVKLVTYLRQQNSNILNDEDEEMIKSKVHGQGRMAGSSELLDRITNYRGWFNGLVQTLVESDINKQEVAEQIIEIEESLCEAEFSHNKGEPLATPTESEKETSEDLHHDPRIAHLLSGIQKSLDVQQQKVDRLTGSLLSLSKDVKDDRLEQKTLKEEIQHLSECTQNSLESINQIRTESKTENQTVQQMLAQIMNQIQHFGTNLEEVKQETQNLARNHDEMKRNIQHLGSNFENVQQEIKNLARNHDETKKDILGVTKMVEESTGTIDNLEDIVLESHKSIDQVKADVSETKEMLSHCNSVVDKLVDSGAKCKDGISKLHLSHLESVVKTDEKLSALGDLVEKHMDVTNTKTAVLSRIVGRLEENKLETLNEIKAGVGENKQCLSQLAQRTDDAVNELTKKIYEKGNEINHVVDEKVGESMKKTEMKLEEITKKTDACKSGTDSISQHISGQLVKDVENAVNPLKGGRVSRDPNQNSNQSNSRTVTPIFLKFHDFS